MKNIGKATCDRCGEEKECVALTVHKKSLFWTEDKGFKLCESCASKLFKMYKKDQ